MFRLITVFISLFISFSSFANVSLKNGNYFVGFTDVFYPGGMEPKIERVYNSKSSYNGYFGFGWGSEYEVYIKVSADGSVVMYENGGGAQNRFTPPTINLAEIDTAVNSILDVKKKQGGLSASMIEAEKKRLKTDARYRNDEWSRLYDKGQVKSRALADGTILKSNKFSYQTLKKTKDGYVRVFDNGQVQTFDNDGHLVKWSDKNANFLAMGYDKRGCISMVKDNLNRQMNLVTNGKCKIEKVTYEKDKYASYKYNDQDELIFSKDVEGNTYEYKYSSNGRHNLVEIKYSDKTTMQLGYWDMAKCENVQWVKERDGTVTKYDYTGECNGGMEHTTSTTIMSSDGKELSKNKYEYYEKAKADGERYTSKLVTNLDGDRTETVYNDLGLPSEINKNGMKTSFVYDSLGHVTKKTTPTEITELVYDKKFNKVVKVSKTIRGGRKPITTTSAYGYDDKGNLVTAKNSEGKAVKLVYDHTGKIKAIIDQKSRRLEFTYNEANRPVEIKDPAMGSIKVEYTQNGEVKKVDHNGDRKIASQITMAFQNLLEILRPAGVSLSF